MTAASGVLAQFGGVTLAFAFIATIGFTGFVTGLLQTTLGIDIYAHRGLALRLPGPDPRLHRTSRSR